MSRVRACEPGSDSSFDPDCGGRTVALIELNAILIVRALEMVDVSNKRRNESIDDRKFCSPKAAKLLQSPFHRFDWIGVRAHELGRRIALGPKRHCAKDEGTDEEQSRDLFRDQLRQDDLHGCASTAE